MCKQSTDTFFYVAGDATTLAIQKKINNALLTHVLSPASKHARG